ncbi:MAG TPA: ABC transporter permease [Acidimicrobiales bacterium]|nr:ABC transporter permease [Acidimicrobiales bacterium]
MSVLAEYSRSRDLFTNLTLRELRSRYKRSFLGWTWSLINPLTYMVIYTVVFGYVLKVRVLHGHPSGLSAFALFLLAGLLPWNFFTSAVNGSVGSLVAASNLIKKSYFPRALLPAATVASALVSHLIEMGLLLVAVLAFGNYRALYLLPFVVLLIALVTIFATGLGLALSAANVYFRDVEHFLGIAFMVWFYLTPIVYPVTYLHGSTLTLIKLNPMADAALCMQRVLYDGAAPSWLELGALALAALVAAAVGLAVFRRVEPRLAEEL